MLWQLQPENFQSLQSQKNPVHTFTLKNFYIETFTFYIEKL